MTGHCAICRKETAKKWINPSNPKDWDYYCEKHLKGIAKGFRCFEELYFLTKNVRMPK